MKRTDGHQMSKLISEGKMQGYSRLFTFCFLLFTYTTSAQTLLTEDDYLQKALAHNPAAQAATLKINQSKALEGTRFSLSSPVVNTESPTGDFYAIGVMQSFRLPGYYQKQGRLLRSQTGLAQAEAGITRAEVLTQARQLYLQAQYYQSLDSLLAYQDSLYRGISLAAQRLYGAGQIDALQAGFARTQAGEIEAARQANQSVVLSSVEQLSLFSGVRLPFRLPSLFSAKTGANPLVFYQKTAPLVQFSVQNAQVSVANTQAELARFKPSFSAGYLNQGPRETPQSLRLRAAIDIPIWTKQHTSAIKAARVGEQIAQRQVDNARLSFQVDSAQITSQRARLQVQIERYRNDLNAESDRIISASTRLRRAGSLDVISHLRTVNEAFGIKLRYLDLLRQWKQTIINANALTTTNQ